MVLARAGGGGGCRGWYVAAEPPPTILVSVYPPLRIGATCGEGQLKRRGGRGGEGDRAESTKSCRGSNWASAFPALAGRAIHSQARRSAGTVPQAQANGVGAIRARHPWRALWVDAD